MSAMVFNNVFNGRLTHKIKSLFPDCQVQAFGSFTSRLYLPHSDIDLVTLIPNYSKGLTSI